MQNRYTFLHVTDQDLERSFECFYEYQSNIPEGAPEPSILHHFGKTKDEQRKNYIQYFSNQNDTYHESPLNLKDGQFGMWLIVDECENEIDIGLIQLERDRKAAKNQVDLLEISIFFIPDYQNKGLGKDIIKLFHDNIYASFAHTQILVAKAKKDSSPVEITPAGISAKIKFINRGSLATFVRSDYKPLDIVDCDNYKKLVTVYGNESMKQNPFYANELSGFIRFFENGFLEAPTSPTLRRKKEAYSKYEKFLQDEKLVTPSPGH